MYVLKFCLRDGFNCWLKYVAAKLRVSSYVFTVIGVNLLVQLSLFAHTSNCFLVVGAGLLRRMAIFSAFLTTLCILPD